MILQLDPPIPVHHAERGYGYAMLAIDYSQEHDLLFTIFFDDGEIWTLPTTELRAGKNITLGRDSLLGRENYDKRSTDQYAKP